MADEIIDYCRAHDLFGDLLTEIEEDNPKQYGRFGPYSRDAGIVEPSTRLGRKQLAMGLLFVSTLVIAGGWLLLAQDGDGSRESPATAQDASAEPSPPAVADTGDPGMAVEPGGAAPEDQGHLYVQLARDPLFPLLREGFLGSVRPECQRVFFYAEDDFDLERYGAMLQGQDSTDRTPVLPWLPAALTFALQADTGPQGGALNVTGLVVEQEYEELPWDVVWVESAPMCASGDGPPLSDLGVVFLERGRAEYSLLGFEYALVAFQLDSGDIRNHVVYLAGDDPGLYHLRLRAEYQFLDSGPLLTESDWFEVVILPLETLTTGYCYEWNDSAQHYELDEREGLDAGFLRTEIQNVVRQPPAGEYVVLENGSAAINLANWHWWLEACDGSWRLNISSSLESMSGATVPPGELARLWIGNPALAPAGAIPLITAQRTFGPCVILGYGSAPLAQYPAR